MYISESPPEISIPNVCSIRCAMNGRHYSMDLLIRASNLKEWRLDPESGDKSGIVTSMDSWNLPDGWPQVLKEEMMKRMGHIVEEILNHISWP